LPEVSIIVPIYNEKKTLPGLLRSLRKVKLDKEIILVDDGSEDGSREFLVKKKGRDVLVLGVHGGKGSALRAGARGARGRFLVFLDADLEYSPGDIPLLVRQARKGRWAVFGSRYLRSYGHPMGVYYFGNRLLNFLLRRRHKTGLTDFETGLKLVPRNLFRKLRLRARGFDIEPELTLALLARGHPIVEVPVSYRPRSRAQGKKVRWQDGLRALVLLLRGERS